MSQLVQKVFTPLHDDERGTSLTEFVIALPVFVLIMSFIYYLGIAGNGLIDEWNTAQRDLWTEVQTIQRAPQDPTISMTSQQKYRDPAQAAAAAQTELNDYGVRNSREEVQGAVASTEQRTLQGLRSSGHWGESAQRTRPPNSTMNLFIRYPSNSPTGTSSNVIGGSGYAAALVNDGSGAGAIDYSGDRALVPVLGAGVRYGVVQVIRENAYAFSRYWEMPIQAEFNVLVPPAPPENAAAVASDIARSQLNSYNPYGELLGINNPQPLRRSSPASVPNQWSTTD